MDWLESFFTSHLPAHESAEALAKFISTSNACHDDRTWQHVHEGAVCEPIAEALART